MNKIILDIVLSILFLIILSPLLIILSILVKYYHGSPILFIQERPGLNDKLFRIYKFRTMTNEREDNGALLSDEKRLTKFGKFLRSTSLDELPELINVLKGDMSIVGPRPLLIEYLQYYTKEQKRRHCVKPGITGYAQINGRNNMTWEEKFKLDVWYVDNRTITLDIKIIIKTIGIVFKRTDINKNGYATTDKFSGV